MAVIYEKGLVVLKKSVLAAAGLKIGSQVQTRAEPGRIIIEPQDDVMLEFQKLRQKANMSDAQAESELAKIEKQMKQKMLYVP